MSTPTDYLSVEQAKIDMRLDDGTFDSDATVERYIGDAVSMVSAVVGYDLLEVETADIKPSLQALVAFAANYRFEGGHDVPAAIYQMAAPHRRLVDEDDEELGDDEVDEDEDMPLPYQTYEVDLQAGQTVTVDMRGVDVPFSWFAVATASEITAEVADEAAPDEGDWCWIDRVVPGEPIRRGVLSPAAWMRWVAANNATGRVRVTYRGSVSATVS